MFLALALSRRYGSFFDKLVVALSPTSSAPPWFYGIFLILIFASVFKVLPFGGMVDAPVPKTALGYSLSLLKHLILPTLALTLSQVFLQIYNWRTFFLIYSSEDYVEIAKAKGLSNQAIERNYVLRPTLPSIITNFALTLIALWLGGPITETAGISGLSSRSRANAWRRFFDSMPKARREPGTRTATTSGSAWITCPSAECDGPALSTTNWLTSRFASGSTALPSA